MTGEAAVSVPGKTILFGEHAAVYGHPAVVTALDLRMMVWARPRTAAGPGTVHVKSDEPGDLADIAVSIGTDGLNVPPAGLDVRIDSAIPPGSGFGSSAALAVAVVAACRRACGDDASTSEIAKLALAVETRQHGRASGVDVEAVLRGGVLWCRRRADGSLEREDMPVTAATLDTFRLFHSGTPLQSTGEMVALVRRLLDDEPVRVRDAFATIDQVTRDGSRALLRGDGAALVDAVRAAEAALELIDVVPSGVRDAIRGIEAEGGAAKISGAGGRTGAGAGLILVAHPDAAWHDRLVRPSGWTPHRVSLGAPGLRTEIPA